MSIFEDILGTWGEEWDMDMDPLGSEPKCITYPSPLLGDSVNFSWNNNFEQLVPSEDFYFGIDTWNGEPCEQTSLPSDTAEGQDQNIESWFYTTDDSCSNFSPVSQVDGSIYDMVSCYSLDRIMSSKVEQLAEYHSPPSSISSSTNCQEESSIYEMNVAKTRGLCCPEKRKREREKFPLELLRDLKGATSAQGRKMTPEERSLMIYKRKLRNRESAARSRKRRTMILDEMREQICTLKTVIERLQCRLNSYQKKELVLTEVYSAITQVQSDLYLQLERLLNVEYQVAILRAKLTGTKMKNILPMKETASVRRCLTNERTMYC